MPHSPPTAPIMLRIVFHVISASTNTGAESLAVRRNIAYSLFIRYNAPLRQPAGRKVEFKIKALTFMGQPKVMPLRKVWDLEDAELSSNATSVVNGLESLPDREIYDEVCWQGQALLEFQDLQDMPPPKRGRWMSNWAYLLCESLNVLRQVVVCGLNGQIHAALAALRSSLEAFVCHYWWRRKLYLADDYECFYDWFNGKDQLRNFSRIITETLKELEHPPGVVVFDGLKEVYSQLCSYAHKPLLDDAIITMRGGNAPKISNQEILYWLLLVHRTQSCMLDVAVLSSPNSVFPVDLYRKFGFNPPVGLFFDLSSGYVLKKALGAERFDAYRRHFERLDPPADLIAWYNEHSDLSDEEILATWKEESPSNDKDRSSEERVVVRSCQMKAKMRAMLWATSYSDVPIEMPDVIRKVKEAAENRGANVGEVNRRRGART